MVRSGRDHAHLRCCTYGRSLSAPQLVHVIGGPTVTGGRFPSSDQTRVNVVPTSPTARDNSYRAFVRRCRQFDRNSLLTGFASASAGWDGKTLDERGEPVPFLPWDVAGAAVTVLRRGRRVSRLPGRGDLIRLAADYTNLDYPDEASSSEELLRMVGRHLYTQWSYQRHQLNVLARSVALLDHTPYPATRMPKILTAGWQELLLGASVREYCSAAFLMHVLAYTGASYPFNYGPDAAVIFDEPGSEGRFHRIVRDHFLTEAASFAPVSSPDGRAFALEPFGFNPLLDTPFVGGILADRWIAPCAPAVLQKASAVSIAYIGLRRFGAAFTNDLGHLFQEYIGRHLALVHEAQLHREFVYYPTSKPVSNDSVDWIMVTPAAVVLIECKSQFPDRHVREGTPSFVNAHTTQIGKGIKQINTTAALIRSAQPEFAHIPTDRPVVGFVVTLGDFDLANDPVLRSHVTRADVPTAVVGSEFIEHAAAHPVAVWNHFLRRAVAATTSSNTFETRHLLDPYPNRRNQIIDNAFSSLPVVSALGAHGPGRHET